MSIVERDAGSVQPNHAPDSPGRGGDPFAAPVSRRRFIGYLMAGPTLIAGVAALPGTALATPLPTAQVVDNFDLSDLLNLSCEPTANRLEVVVGKDGMVHFDMPRAEVGQGITTAAAMIIADEIGIPISRVAVTLKDADPKLQYNQLTGGSNTIHSIYTPLRTAAATARTQLTRTAARMLGVDESSLSIADGAV